MTEQQDGQMTLFDPDSWSGKTSPEHSAATKARTSESSSKRRQGLRTVVPLFLDLRKENGLLREPSWEMGGPLLGEFSMRSFGECPREDVESHLSQILEENAHPKYYLSAKACQGILRRAEKRGKELPPILKTALIAQSASKSELESLGGVKESSYSTTESAHSQPSTIKPSLICLNDQGGSVMSVSKDKSGTLRAQEHGHQPAICYGISAYESNAMKSSNPNSGVYLAETARTLDNNGGSPACNQGGMAIAQCYDARGNGDGDTAPTMTGDHQSRITDYTAIITGPDTVSTLQARDYKGVGRMDTVSRLTYSLQGSMIGRADKNGPQGDGVNKDRSFTLNSTDRHAVTDAAIVRRLTPLECERLQGYPDGWTDIGDWTDSKGKTRKCADSARYKALGNSIALPPWTYVLTRLNAYCKEHTMASLFDGIGGFPLIWTRLGGSCLWASEIEEFPIAVTKIRFGQE